MNVIELVNITKCIGDFSLTELNFKIQEGEKWAIIAPSGGGKTTLLRIMLGLDPPDSGVVTYGEGQDTRDFLEDTGVEWAEATLPLHFTPWQVERVFSSQYETWDSDEYHILLNNLDISRKKPLETIEKARDCLFATLMARHPILYVEDQEKGLQGSQEVEGENTRTGSQKYPFLQTKTQLFCVNSMERVPSHVTHLAFMREGELLFQGEKEKLLRDCATVDCAPSDVDVFSREDYLAVRETDVGMKLLVEDRFEFFLKYPAFPFQDTTIDEVSDLILQGGRV